MMALRVLVACECSQTAARLGAEYVAERLRHMERAERFFLRFTRLQCPFCIENPPGRMSTRWRRPDQVIQPYDYGDAAQKATCLWLCGLPRLIPTNPVDKPPVHAFPSANTMSSWYYETSKLPAKDRARVAARHFQASRRRWRHNGTPLCAANFAFIRTLSAYRPRHTTTPQKAPCRQTSCSPGASAARTGQKKPQPRTGPRPGVCRHVPWRRKRDRCTLPGNRKPLTLFLRALFL